MSNAMRFSKRSLAAVAAGALGAALIPFVAAPSATAGTAATIAFNVPSVTIIGSNFTAAASNVGAQIPVGVTLFDAAGDQVATADDTRGLSVELQITAPATAVDDDSVAITNFPNGTGTAIKLATSNYTNTSLAAITLSPNGISGTSWDSIVSGGVSAGTYTLTARLFSTGSGAVVSTTSIPITVSNNLAAPAPTVQFANAASTSATNANVINALGATAGDSVGDPSGKINVYLTNSTGGPYYILDDSVTVSATNTSGDVTYPNPAGGLQAGAAPNPIYSFTSAGGAWGTSSSATVTATVTPGATATTGTLPVAVASANALSSAPTVELTTAGYLPSSTEDTYQVPPGTTSLSFSVATADGLSASTLAYNAVSSRVIALGGGTVTPSGGATAISADAGTINVTLNAAAAASGRTLFLTVGDYRTASRTTTVEVDFVAPTATIDALAPITQVGTASTIPGTILSQYGAVLPGAWAISAKNGAGASCSATSIATTTAAADGSFSITIPASFAPTSASTRSFTICASNGFSTTQANVPVTYTASGGLNALTMSVTSPSLTSAFVPVVSVPANGVANLTTNTSNSVAASSVASADVNASGTQNSFEVTVTSSPAANITLSGPTGVFFTTATTGALVASAGSNPLNTATSGSTPTKVISVYATKPGTHTVTVTGGTSTATITFVAGVAIGSGRTLTATPTSIELAPNEFKSASVTLVDLYGNPVPDDTGIAVALAGGGTLSSTSTITNASGVATVFYTAPLGTGTGQLLWSIPTGKYISGAITGFPAAVNTATTGIVVRNASTKSIVIVGERGTVSGKSGILVEGSTSGFDVGSKMVPSIRFPGETTFTAGTARPTTSASGDFSWQRKTGKRVTVFFSNEAGDVKSNRVTIQAN